MPYAEARSIDLRESSAILQRKWSVIVLTLLVLGVALAVAYLRTPSYSSTARVEVLPPTAQGALAPTSISTFVNMDNELVRVLSTQIQIQAADRLKAGGQDAALATDADVSVSVPANTNYMDIGCTTEQAVSAQTCAQAYADAYVADRKAVLDRAVAELRAPPEKEIEAAMTKIGDLDASLAETTDPTVRANLLQQRTAQKQILASAQLALQALPTPSNETSQVVTPADLPTVPSNKDYVMIGILAGILGLALGIGLAFARQRMDQRVGERERLDDALGTPVLAVIPHVARRRGRKHAGIVSVTDPKGDAAEAYRSARATVLYLAREHGLKSILVTGPGQGEGTSTTTANLGVALARSGYRVVVLSCDLRKPTLHRLFGNSNEPGLADVLRLKAPLRDALARTDVPSLLLIPSGTQPANPSELLASRAMGAVLQELRANADFVLLDTPPSLVVADALELASIVDGILVVADGANTTHVDVRRLRDQLDQVGGRMIGCVLNNVDPKAAPRFGAYPAHSPSDRSPTWAPSASGSDANENGHPSHPRSDEIGHIEAEADAHP